MLTQTSQTGPMELYACRAATAEQFESLVFFLDVQEHTNPRFKQAPAMPDPVAAVHRRFTHQELPSRVFLNSVPKCGTMLLRNILAMFIPWEEIYWTFITNNNLPQHQKAIQSPRYKFFTGHLDHTPETSILMRDFTLILNIRDPYGYVLSNARFFYSQPKYKDSVLARYIQDHSVTFDDVVPLVINGFCFHGEVVPNVVEVYVNKAMNWFRTAGKVVSYEELCRHIQNLSTSEAKTYFQDIVDLLQIDTPRDWRQRVLSGSAPEISTTFSGNLGADVVRRNHLLDSEKKLFSLVAPHLREILGYEQQEDC